MAAMRDTTDPIRLMWAERIGLGFELPGSAKLGQRGQLLQFRKAV